MTGLSRWLLEILACNRQAVQTHVIAYTQAHNEQRTSYQKFCQTSTLVKAGKRKKKTGSTEQQLAGSFSKYSKSLQLSVPHMRSRTHTHAHTHTHRADTHRADTPIYKHASEGSNCSPWICVCSHDTDCAHHLIFHLGVSWNQHPNYSSRALRNSVKHTNKDMSENTSCLQLWLSERKSWTNINNKSACIVSFQPCTCSCML